MLIILVIVSFIGSSAVRWWMKRTYARWHSIPNAVGANGWQVARHILDSNGLHQVQLEVSDGELSDHYIPSQKLLRLSESINFENSIASIAVAAHECGHAIQDAQNYPPLRWKALLMPAALASNNLGLMLTLGGGLFGSSMILNIGMLMFAVGIFMPLLTLPIEFDASKRALAQLQKLQLVNEQDYDGAKSMLTAAALTYVAGAASSMIVVALIALRLFKR